MNHVAYRCNHCGNRFQGEDREGIECPKCFWSSSVQKDDGSIDFSPSSGAVSTDKSARRIAFPAWLITGLIVIAAGIGLAVLIMTVRKSGVLEKVQKIDLSPSLSFGKGDAKKKSPMDASLEASAPQAADPELAGLSEEEKRILTTPLEVQPPVDPSPEEGKILSQFAEFKTGFSESLPSQPWTLQSFDEMLKEQEAFYKVPLPGSYRRKLIKLFETHYLPGKTAFEQQDLLNARNHWVDSLNFPMYSDKIERHRGVALTMLKPFINDTLSKIGAINSSILEKNIRLKEQSVSQNYQTLVTKLKAREWAEAASIVAGIQQLLTELENPEQIAGKAPPYPASISTIDQGIRDTLVDFLEAPAPPVTAFDALRLDLAKKTRILNGFIPERFEEAKRTYAQGMEMIAKKDWNAADAELRKVSFPAALFQDAEAKRAILRKLQPRHEEKPTAGGLV